jgi:hypothetical protein
MDGEIQATKESVSTIAGGIIDGKPFGRRRELNAL